MEQTLVILKPDAVKRGIVGEIVSRFERAGLKIVATKMLQPDNDQFYHHYENISKMVSRRGKEAFEVTLAMMQEGPVILLVLEGVKAVSLVRKMVGETEPEKALPGTIRGDFAHKHVSGFDFRPDVHDARLIQTAQHALRQIGDVTGDFFRSQLGIACNDRQFLNVN